MADSDILYLQYQWNKYEEQGSIDSVWNKKPTEVTQTTCFAGFSE